MNGMKWKEMNLVQKVATIVAWIAVLVMVVSKVQPDLFPIDMAYPTIALFTVCEGVVYWSYKRKWAYLLIAAAVISMACFVAELCLM